MRKLTIVDVSLENSKNDLVCITAYFQFLSYRKDFRRYVKDKSKIRQKKHKIEHSNAKQVTTRLNKPLRSKADHSELILINNS